MIFGETGFWNNSEIVGYFAAKPADPVIVERLGCLDVHETDTALALDLGCGGGRHAELLARSGYMTTAVDVNPAMLQHTRNRLRAQALPGNYALMSISGLGFQDETFDVVVSTGVLHQARSHSAYEHAVSEVGRVLKKSGLFTMNVFTNRVWDETYSVPDQTETNTVLTAEGLWMTLLDKSSIYDIAASHGLELEQEVAEDIRQENTGERAVLRAHFIKTG